VCGLTLAVGLQCSVKVDDVIQTEVHKNLQCSGNSFIDSMHFLISQPDAKCSNKNLGALEILDN